MKTCRIFTCALLALCLLLCPLLSACGGGETSSESESAGAEEYFDYLALDFSKYVDYPRSLYTGQRFEITPKKEITEANVDKTVEEILFANGTWSDAPVSERITQKGDGLWLWISMYHEGRELIDLCNYALRGERMIVGDNSQLFPSSPELAPEIEAAVEGLDISTTRLERKTGAVKAGDVIFVTFTPDDPKEAREGDDSRRVDLSDPALAAIFAGKETAVYGDRNALTNAEASTVTDIVLDGRRGSARVECILGDVEEYISVMLPLTGNYRTAEGTVTFDKTPVECRIIVNQCFAWITPEFDEDFILNVLKQPAYDEETGEALRGDALVAKHREYLRLLLIEEAENLYLAERDAVIGAYLEETFRVLEYPETAIREIREPFIREVTAAYEQYVKVGGNHYASLDAYAVAHLLNEYGMEAEGTLAEIATAYAQRQVKGLLSVYYLAKAENLVPDNEEIDLRSYEVLENLVKSAEEADTPLTEDEILAYYGGWENFRMAVREEMLHEAVLDFLEEANETVPPASPEE